MLRADFTASVMKVCSWSAFVIISSIVVPCLIGFVYQGITKEYVKSIQKTLLPLALTWVIIDRISYNTFNFTAF